MSFRYLVISLHIACACFFASVLISVFAYALLCYACICEAGIAADWATEVSGSGS